MKTSPTLSQDRVADLFDTFEKYGYVMFPQQLAIYQNISRRLIGPRILEAGCGTGIGSAIIEREMQQNDSGWLTATDVSSDNVVFARCMYPWMDFQVWDVCNELQIESKSFDSVVCVECVEHVDDTQSAIKNLIDAAVKEVWITSSNNYKAYSPPENPYYIAMFSVKEMLQLLWNAIGSKRGVVSLHHWETFEKLESDTKVSPLVYHLTFN